MRRGSALLVAAAAAIGAADADTVVARQTPRADLKIATAPKLPSTVTAGKTLRVSLKVANAGSRRAARTRVAVLLSRDRRLDRRDTLLGTASVRPLAARKRVTVRARLRMPSRTGRHRLLVCADDRRKVRERSERNNCRATRAFSLVRAGEEDATGGLGGAVGIGVGTGPGAAPIDGGGPGTGGPSGPPPGGPGTDPGTPPGDGGGQNPGPTEPKDQPLPPAPPAQPRSVADASKQLYSGPDAAQTGVAAGTIEERRIAVLSGRVIGEDGQGLAGVEVTALDHPELGRTTTRADGGYAFAVNGGAPVVVSFAKAGFLPSQRPVETPWREYVPVEDVMLLPRDAKATTIDPGAAGAPDLAVVRGSQESDGQGDRTATLLFPKGTNATLRRADGSTVPLDGPLTVRATEYTAAGEQAMPGELPPGTGYTYAADYSIDQADAAGAVSVQFDKPVVNYTENIIGAPVGSPVPTGSYDRAEGRWKPEPNGRVIKVLDIAGGKASLDIDGDGAADEAGKLAALGIDDAELTKLGGLYAKGTELWRVRMTHFSPWDHNWPYGPPPGAKAPKLKFFDELSQDPCLQGGSKIDCETRVLGESLGVTGTGYGLHYRSDRVPGAIADDELRVPITGATLPNQLKTAVLTVNIAGRYFTYVWTNHPGTQFPPLTANITQTVKWDHKDYWGNLVQGRPKAYITLEYIYPQQYYESSDAFESSFGQFPTTTEVFGARRACGNSLYEYACGISIFSRTTSSLGGWDAQGADRLGGWTLGAHHGYDVSDGTLHRGDGSVVEARALGPRLQIAAGDGENFPAAEGKPATEANIDYQGDMAVGPDGTIVTYTAGDFFGNDGDRLRRVDPKDGTIHTFAGNGEKGDPQCDGGPALERSIGSAVNAVAIGPDGTTYLAATGTNWPAGYICAVRDGKLVKLAGVNDRSGTGGSGDGGPAVNAKVSDPLDVAVGPDGLVYWTERPEPANGYRGAVRRIEPDGTVQTVVGGGAQALPAPGAAGKPARSVDLGLPYGLAWNSLGELFIPIPTLHRVVKVGLDGQVTNFAGDGTTSDIGWGLPAATSPVRDPVAVAVGPDDKVYVRTRDWDGDRVVTVDADGGIQPLIGRTCRAPYNPTDGEAAAARCLGTHARGMSVAPDGAVYVTQGRQWILRTEPALPGFGTGSILVPSSDGTEVYEFNATGRHLRTVNGLTGDVIRTFGYDASGLLSTITEQPGNRVTRILRGDGGRAYAIVAPGGQQTQLTQSTDGWLTGVRNPAGEQTTLGYGAGGLLTSLTDPLGGKHEFTYDAGGRLATDRNPAGLVKTLTSEAVDGGSKVTVKVNSGATTTYLRRVLDSGDEERVTTEPSGAVTRTVRLPDGSTTQTRPDGTTITTVQGADPRWGNAAPYTAEQETVTPDGHKRIVETTRSADLEKPGDLLHVVRLNQTTRVNGNAFTKSYDGATRTLEEETPEGRRRASTLDGAGRVTSVDLDVDDDQDEPIAYVYDDRGRLAQTKQGTDTQTLAYDALDRVASRTDALGRRVTYGYDAADRMTRMTLPGGDVYTFGYDADGRRTSVTLPGGATHQLPRTADGLDAGYVAPGAAALTRSYDQDRRLSSTTLAGGRTLDLDYDAGGRPAAERFAEGAVDFDMLDDKTDRPGAIKRLKAGGEVVQALAFAYDGAAVKSLAATGAATGSYAYSYDDAGYLVGTELQAAGKTIATTLGRDQDGLLVGDGPFTITRDGPQGAATQIDDGTRRVDLGYDAHGRSDTRSLRVAGDQKYKVDLTRNAAGLVTKRVETVGATTTTWEYAYDADDRLEEVKRDGTVVESYGYDARGNRTSAGGAAATFDARDRLTKLGAVTYASDADGFVTGRGSDTFTYSARGELLSASAGGKTVTYAYDGLGRRVARAQDGKTEQYLYGDLADPYKVTASIGDDGLLTVYHYDDAGLLTAFERDGKRYAVASDQVGTPVAVYDDTGALVKRVDRDTWGVVKTDSAPAFALPIGYAGGLEDPVTKLVRFGLRDYDPAAGRWMARDPARFQGGQANLYAYVGSDPVRQRDPSGLICISASLYEGIGGGGEICINEKGISSCVEVGIGVGGGLGIKTGDPASRSGLYTSGEASLKWGPLGIGDGFEIDPCGQDSYKISANAGPYSAEISASRDASGNLSISDSHSVSLNPEDYGAEALGSTEFKAEAKLAGKYCATTLDM